MEVFLQWRETLPQFSKSYTEIYELEDQTCKIMVLKAYPY